MVEKTQWSNIEFNPTDCASRHNVLHSKVYRKFHETEKFHNFIPQCVDTYQFINIQA